MRERKENTNFKSKLTESEVGDGRSGDATVSVAVLRDNNEARDRKHLVGHPDILNMLRDSNSNNTYGDYSMSVVFIKKFLFSYMAFLNNLSFLRDDNDRKRITISTIALSSERSLYIFSHCRDIFSFNLFLITMHMYQAGSAKEILTLCSGEFSGEDQQFFCQTRNIARESAKRAGNINAILLIDARASAISFGEVVRPSAV